MLIYYALNITSLKVTDTTKPMMRNSPKELIKNYKNFLYFGNKKIKNLEILIDLRKN